MSLWFNLDVDKLLFENLSTPPSFSLEENFNFYVCTIHVPFPPYTSSFFLYLGK